jgi:RNA polymerase sigma-70 factor (ECF subfamily)
LSNRFSIDGSASVSECKIALSDLGSQSNQRIIEGRPRVVAALAKRFGSLDIAEEAAAEAFATAVP